MTQRQTYAAALVDALLDEMSDDPMLSLIGSCPLGLGPERLLTEKIREAHPEAVFDPPTAEAAVAAVGIGAAMAGVRSFVDMGTASFAYLAWMQVVNEAANAHLMSGGRICAPATFHCLGGIRGAGAPQHSQSLHAMMWNAPGIEIVVPSTAADVYGLVRSSIRSPNPTFIFSHARILGIETEIAEVRAAIPFGKAAVKRSGSDITIVAISISVHHALAAADILSREGIEAEIIDPRTLVPLDEETVLESVAKTGGLIVVDEAPMRCGPTSEIAATVVQKGFKFLKSPIVRVARPDAPVAYSSPLEQAVTPGPRDIVGAVRKLLAARRS